MVEILEKTLQITLHKLIDLKSLSLVGSDLLGIVQMKFYNISLGTNSPWKKKQQDCKYPYPLYPRKIERNGKLVHVVQGHY